MWRRHAAGHALAKFLTTPGKLTLKDIARHPIVTYETQFAGRSKIDDAFAEAGIEPSIVLEAVDADVIKTYVQSGMGVGIIAGVAVDARRDGLVVLPCGHLFGTKSRGSRSRRRLPARLRLLVHRMLVPGWDRQKLHRERSRS